jgi:hypothetical protein
LQTVVQLTIGAKEKTEFNELLSVAYSSFSSAYFNSPVLMLTFALLSARSDRRQDERALFRFRVSPSVAQKS